MFVEKLLVLAKAALTNIMQKVLYFAKKIFLLNEINMVNILADCKQLEHHIKRTGRTALSKFGIVFHLKEMKETLQSHLKVRRKVKFRISLFFFDLI